METTKMASNTNTTGWPRFWRAGERAFDNFGPVTVTLAILRLNDIAPVPLALIIVCVIIGVIGSAVCDAIADYAESKPG